jgi:hypothetical protein
VPSEWRPVPSHPPQYWIAMCSISWYRDVRSHEEFLGVYRNQQFCECFFLNVVLVSNESFRCRFFSGSSVARTLCIRDDDVRRRRMSSTLTAKIE